MGRALLRVALTGGIATGKSYCLRHFQHAGIPTLDADQLAREAMGPGTPGQTAVIERFGAHLVGADGGLDRAALGRLVFADAGARQALEQIVHPFVYGAVRKWLAAEARALEAAAGAAGPGLAIVDIPLLYETGGDRDFDRVVVAACGADQQRARVMARDGLSQAEAEQRIAAQMPIGEKRARADYVIDTSGSIAETDAQLAALTNRLRADAADQRDAGA